MKPFYEDGAVTIYHGDCREILPVLGAFDLTLTDPPYGVGIDYGVRTDDSRDDYAEWSASWLNVCSRPLVFTPGTTRLGMWMRLEQPTWVCAWFKPNQASASAIGGFNVWEPILVYGKPKKRVGHDAWNHLVSFREREYGAGDHPVPKTLTFWKLLVRDFSDPGDRICDPMMGSGTTLVAAKELGRRAVGIDIEERWCEQAARRCSQEVLGLSA